MRVKIGFILFQVFCIVVVLQFSTSASFKNSTSVVSPFVHKDDTLTFLVPDGWPEPAHDFKNNPITKNGIALGRELFYDPKLSRDGTISCSSCHLSYTGFTHIDHSLSHGIEGRIGTRNSLAIINPAWQKTFMWDGGFNNLQEQAKAPLTSHDEMDGDIETVLKMLAESPEYVQKFKKAFGIDAIVSEENMFNAITQFVLTFNSSDSKYDKVMRQEEGYAFTERESNGYELFKLYCASCHKEPLFTDYSFRNNGLAIDTLLNDGGRIKITGKKRDSLKFKVPTLRNIEVTYPYMHDGRYRKLEMVMFHYANDIHHTKNLDKRLAGDIDLTGDDKKSIIAFLKTLTDMSFLRRPELAYPK